MRPLLGLLAGLALALWVVVPAAVAESPLAHTGRVLVSTEGDVVIPAGEHADVVVVVNGNAEIRGEVNSLVVVDGTVLIEGATLESVLVVRSSVEIGAGTIVYGEVQRVDAQIHQNGNPQLRGGIVDLGARWFEIGAMLAPALALLWLGFGLANVVVGLLVAALAGRQLHGTARLISREPVLAGVAGLLSAILIPIVGVLLFPTIVGAPLGFGILLVGLPLAAFGGYLVAAAWLGEILLRLAGRTGEPERPYLATVVGVVVLGLLGLVPVLGVVVALASLFGFGAVIVAAIRTIAGGSRPYAGTTQPLPMPTGA